MYRYRYLKIPGNWSPEQAWAVVEFLHLLEELIWETHEVELLKLVGPDPSRDRPPDNDPCFGRRRYPFFISTISSQNNVAEPNGFERSLWETPLILDALSVRILSYSAVRFACQSTGG